jgi:hypothetical protein
MKRFSDAQFSKAREFIMSAGRPIEQANFELEFENGTQEAVYAALSAHQNPDGGFGHALEPDVRSPLSSALATSIGLSDLKRAGAPPDHPLVLGAVKYLIETFDSQRKVWRILPPGASEQPHAPWWHDDGDSLANTFGGFVINPRAKILSLLYHFNAPVTDRWLLDVTEDTVQAVEHSDLTGGDFDNAVELAETTQLPLAYRQRLAARIRSRTLQVVELDPANWNDYCLPPLWAAPAPDTLVADQIWSAIMLHLDYLVEHQQPEGFWEPNWSWGNFYPEIWPQGRQEWRGELTVRNLRFLRAYDRLEGRVSEPGQSGAR